MRPKIFSVINKIMKGRWAETAMQETGSIICQNIFESADVEEKVRCVKRDGYESGPVDAVLPMKRRGTASRKS